MRNRGRGRSASTYCSLRAPTNKIPKYQVIISESLFGFKQPLWNDAFDHNRWLNHWERRRGRNVLMIDQFIVALGTDKV
jgi:hypothetical protein